MFTVTRRWIMKHRTKRGAWTGPQLAALGINIMNNKRGWMDRVEGMEISDLDRRLFESALTAKQRRKQSAETFTNADRDWERQVAERLDRHQAYQTRHLH